MENIFLEITIIICLVAVLSVIFQKLNQPTILAYISAGIIVGPIGFFNIHNQEILQVLSTLGITLLLFMLGLEIRFRDFLSIGKDALIVSIGLIASSISLFYVLSLVLGFPQLSAFYVGLVLMDSSLIIAVKLLSDKKDLHSLYGKMSIGILLMQDFVIIIVLIFLSAFSAKTLESGVSTQFILALIKSVFLVGIIWYLSRNIFPKIVEKLSRFPETLFLVSLAWVLGLAALVGSPLIGFSKEIGGLLAGLSLASSIANYQIIAKVKVLRDFFIVLFFVVVGINMSFEHLGVVLPTALILSLAVLLAKPLIVMILMGVLGFRKRSSFLTGINLAQTSEFSLIVIFLGNKLGHISNQIVELVTLVSIITFALSTYVIVNNNRLYVFLSRYLKIFERKNTTKEGVSNEALGLDSLDDHVVLIGGDQMGESILEVLQDLGNKVVVVDFDPAIVKKLNEKKSFSIYGDISDLDIQDRAKLNLASLIISTIPDIEDNLLLLKKHKVENRRAKIVVMALDSTDAKILYREGADYVILPHLAGGRQIAEILKENRLEEITKLRSKDMKYLT